MLINDDLQTYTIHSHMHICGNKHGIDPLACIRDEKRYNKVTVVTKFCSAGMFVYSILLDSSNVVIK